MIRIHDATMLALTKLRTRKVRLIITILISGLLFSGLAGASYVIRGMIASASSFNKEGLGNRYIVQANTQPSVNFFTNPDVINRAIDLQKDLVARKKAAAKALDLTYDPATDVQAYIEYDGPNGVKQRSLNPTSPAGVQAVKEYLAAHPLANEQTLQQVAAKYHPLATYNSQPVPYAPGGGQLQVLKNGQEKFDTGNNGFKGGSANGIDSFVTSWSTMSSGLLQPFLLHGQSLAAGKDGSIPIVVPRSAAEQILGLKGLSPSATGEQRLERTKEIRSKAPNVEFTVCYRNGTSATMVNSAISTQQEIDKNKGNRDYQKPDLIYGLPTTPCGPVPTVRDVRTYDDKVMAANQTKFNQMFGEEPAEQQILTFRIVGIVPDADLGSAFGIGQVVRTLITSSLGGQWYMPTEQLAGNPLLTKLFTSQEFFGGGQSYYAEFATADQARTFIDKENCSVDYGKLGPDNDPASFCLAQGHPFGLNPYGSNSLALESASKNFAKFFKIGALVVSGIATVIMMGTVGRMIADSRRETAVFRAIGAKKLDIAQIYVTYAFLLSLMVALFALAVGFIGSGILNQHYSARFTVEAVNAFNSADLNKQFTLYSFYPTDILMLVGLAVAAGLLSAVFPLLRNLRRNPIRDMRDDT